MSVMLGNRPQQDLTLRLYTGPTGTPTAGLAWADVSEAAGSGYVPAPLLSSGWDVHSDELGVVVAVHPQVSFEFAMAAEVYGYVVTTEDGGSRKICWIERFARAPFVLPAGGGDVAITPTFRIGLPGLLVSDTLGRNV